ncbi:hypothetical protein AXF42_Ash009777 [Apostasia shenzhenica]|uniref:Retrovirus-related Pol polyprotein from transposon TNT 1-94 n=1 Tax=Apostasia shenzhenica TaxID=1088818 RepID=A0A2I0AX21_9ASPA|nr:hypothetical protein AXF42_Ash009777 [Apostasia shenzhenica]
MMMNSGKKCDLKRKHEVRESKMKMISPFQRNGDIKALIHPNSSLVSMGVRTRTSFLDEHNYTAFISKIEPKSIDEAKSDGYWMIAMQEELNQFTQNEVCELVAQPNDHLIIGTK